MVQELREFGADVFEFPTIAIEPTLPDEPIEDLQHYNWIVFTSVNGVEMLFERMEEQGWDGRDLAGVKICVIGTATADAVAKRFLRYDCMPKKYVAEHLLEALKEQEPDLAGKRFLLPRADIARSFLPKALREAGAEVTELVTYRTVKPTASDDLADALLAYKPDLVTFTSSSTTRNFCEMVGPERTTKLKETARFAAIGPITAATAEEHGLPVTIEPAEHDVPHFIEAIVDNL
jgi:uroporphyrinogen III methyltransferase/synthase